MDRELLRDVTPIIEDLGRRDAHTDALAGNRDRYTTYLALYADGSLSVAQWQQYRAAYEAEHEQLAAS